MIVEERPENLEYISTILTKAGYHLEIAINGLFAMTRIVSEQYDLLILDIFKPTVKGEDFFLMVKTFSRNRYLPVILILPQDEMREFTRGVDIGGYDFVGFPIDEKELLTRINYQLELKNARIQLKRSKSFQSSLNYAHQIQVSLLPSNQLLDDLFSNYFLLSLPLDIVSGDFFWIKRIESYVIVAVADATGHGVPGALLSILGISLLNEMSSVSRFTNPGDILDELREKVKNSLQNSQFNTLQYNGLDMTICIINSDSGTLSFSGANNSVYIFKNEEMTELKGDRQPIGSYFNEKPFRNQSINLDSGDRIYFSSDGYSDQIGGSKNTKRFQRRNFRNLLGEVAKLPLPEQKDILLSKHLEWKGDNDQVDDILVLGIELPALQEI